MQRKKCLNYLGGSRGARNYLKFTALAAATISLVKVGNPLDVSLQTSLNGGVWQTYTTGNTITLNVGDELRWRATTYNTSFSSGANSYYQYNCTGTIEVGGNAMSLIDSTCHSKRLGQYAFKRLFYQCNAITSAPSIECEIWGDNCCEEMFRECVNLVDCGNLRISAKNQILTTCFSSMFRDCTSIVTTPEVVLTDSALYFCCGSMFSGCTSLTDARPFLLKNIICMSQAFNSAFRGCSNLIYISDIDLETRSTSWGDFSDMYRDCVSIEEVNLRLSAGSGSVFGASEMFDGCTGIQRADISIFAQMASSFSIPYLFRGCINMVCQHVLIRTPQTDVNCSEAFRNCKKVSAISILGFTGQSWNNYGFLNFCAGCSVLSRVEVEFTAWPTGTETAPIHNWMSGVAAIGDFVCPANLPLEYGSSRIPTGWNVIAT